MKSAVNLSWTGISDIDAVPELLDGEGLSRFGLVEGGFQVSEDLVVGVGVCRGGAPCPPPSESKSGAIPAAGVRLVKNSRNVKVCSKIDSGVRSIASRRRCLIGDIR